MSHRICRGPHRLDFVCCQDHRALPVTSAITVTGIAPVLQEKPVWRGDSREICTILEHTVRQ